MVYMVVERVLDFKSINYNKRACPSGAKRFIRIHESSTPIGRIHDSYNCKLDVFVDANSIRDILSYGSMNFPERNDGIDIVHFYYFDRNTILLTEDNKQRKTAENVNLRVKSIRDFIPKKPNPAP